MVNLAGLTFILNEFSYTCTRTSSSLAEEKDARVHGVEVKDARVHDAVISYARVLDPEITRVLDRILLVSFQQMPKHSVCLDVIIVQ